MRSCRIAYVGTMGSGRTTSLFQVLRGLGQPLPEHHLSNVEYHTSIQTENDRVQLTLTADRFRGWHAYTDPKGDALSPELRGELQRLPTFDGFIYVIDSRMFRIRRCQDEFEQLAVDLLAYGAELRRRPVVFQVNFRDQPDICGLSWVTEHFSVPRCQYIESVASTGHGTLDAVRALLGLLS
jgi:hypothetical protein